MSSKVLVLGGGGREHALSWKLAQSPEVKAVYVAPGNAGTARCGKVDNVVLNLKDFDEVSRWCKDNEIDLVVVGPEDPLAAGISDHLTAQGITCFGPSKEASQIESSKEFSKNFMKRHDIPTARFACFTNAEDAINYIESADFPALVVKASGLAAGKGVVIATNKAEACQAVKECLQEKKFGASGETVVVEELLQGEEVSILAFSDGTTVSLMPAAQDHKRLLDRDEGPNTGGMGAVCPYPKVGFSDLRKIKEDIMQKTVQGLKEEGIPYVGVLYAGLMMTDDGPKVLEYNCRFGDPETQSILPLMKSDLYTTCVACVKGTLNDNLPEYDLAKKVLGVVLVSGGYPGAYKKGCAITGLEEAENLGITVFHAGTAVKDDSLVTSGGRVLAVMAMESNFETAASVAQKGAEMIKFDGVYHRKDIGFRVVSRSLHTPPLSYKDAGVDIAAGNNLVQAIKPLAASSTRSGCMAALGSFGALFDLKAAGFQDPILVSGTDGVGTKLKIAQAIEHHKSIGIDLVAMCINDILAHGAEPLYFLDYYATGKLKVSVARDVIEGITEGCRLAGCALVGGETAEMPGMYQQGDYDIAGFAVGAVERNKILPRVQNIRVGDAVIGLGSSGLHSNGFSLVRKLVEKLELRYDKPSPFKTGNSLGDDLLTPTRIYVNSVLPLMKTGDVKAFAHITGGGLIENIPRILPDGHRVRLDASKWNMPPVFGWLSEKGNIPESEMAKTFNCGIGAVLIVDQSLASQIVEQLSSNGETAAVIGSVEKQTGERRVIIEKLQSALIQCWRHVPGVSRKKRVGVLISGSGTNLQALIDFTRDASNFSAAELVLVISNKPDVPGLKRAEKAGIATKVISHKNYGSREEFDDALHHSLVAAGVEIVCLAGFMRILSGDFVKKWSGRMLNVHPSLLPSFKGHDAHWQVLKSGVRISGCSVHFVAEEVDAGAILVQESVPVYHDDTEDILSERIKQKEHKAYPKALEMVASEQVKLKPDGRIEWCF
ncbi:trifunctional purine biosynthetic protein adenosine-3-like [Mercenaria mercenaria]|uniref:trifunctional purine biosynthetic protein adenosine-3-like n=1 Tax=Mercenaria mercenaria TaxID=6596 RepID=UPI00234EE64C|nr:trifunctional purine biosynthetic protein adenosine-3-like [Mercenaria mercenaria]